MNIKSIAYTLFALVALSSCSYKEPNSLKRYNLNGKVKSVITTTYDASMNFGMVQTGRIIEEDYCFNWGENVRDLKPKEILEFNEDGYITLEIIYTGDGKEKFRTEYEWDNNRLDALTVHFDGEKYRANYKYEKNGSKEICTTYSSDGEKIERNETTLDKKGRPVEVIRYDSIGEILSRRQIEYNRKDLVTRVTEYGEDPDDDFVRDMTYDGKIKRSARYTSIHYPDEYAEILFDEHGNKISLKKMSWSKPKYTFEYEYDKKGNWTTCYVYFKGQIECVQKREICYY